MALGPMKGGIVVSKSKELLNQAYAQLRLLDSVNTLKINRLASSLQMNSPIVEHITPEKKSGNQNEEDEADQREKLFNFSLTNVRNNASWDLSDVIMSPPNTLSHVLKKR